MSDFFLGADIGGTKTHVLIANQDGRVVGFSETGPGNPETVGYEGLTQAYQRSVGMALAQAGISARQIAGVGLGVAGYDWLSQREITLAALTYPNLDAPRELVNDSLLGLLAGSEAGWGIAVVSGTGCNCWGWDQARQRLGQMTGGGTAMGEAAGASELVAEALCRVAHAWTLRGPQTCLAQSFVEYAGAKDTQDLLEGLMAGNYQLRASAAPLIFQAAEAGDSVAQALVEWAGVELGEMANAVIRQLHLTELDFDVVLLGSMFAAGESLIQPLRQTIHAFAPGARLVRLTHPPVTGAVLLGMEAARNKIAPEVRRALFSFKNTSLGV